jgi:putative transcriptional regulator
MNIKEIRKQLGMTSQEFATVVGVSISTVSRWETGRSKPSKLATTRINESIKITK